MNLAVVEIFAAEFVAGVVTVVVILVNVDVVSVVIAEISFYPVPLSSV